MGAWSQNRRRSAVRQNTLGTNILPPGSDQWHPTNGSSGINIYIDSNPEAYYSWQARIRLVGARSWTEDLPVLTSSPANAANGLSAGTYQVQLRWLTADDTRSDWSATQLQEVTA